MQVGFSDKRQDHTLRLNYPSVDAIRSKVSDIFNDPRLYVYARRVHDTSVNTTHESAERNKSGKRKRKREVVSEPEDTPDLIAMRIP